MKNVGWSEEVGVRPYRVIAEERIDRKGMVYLRSWDGAARRWRPVSTGLKVRNQDGTLSPRKVTAVLAATMAHHAALTQGKEGEAVAPLTILRGLELVTDKHSGKYPKESAHRKEVERELTRAAAILGANRTWNSLRPIDLVTLYRKRAAQLAEAGHVGRRGAEITVARMLAVAEWLRGNGLIEVGACHAPKEWKQTWGGEIEGSEPKRPRHTREEMVAIFAATAQVDPRLGLMYRVGVGLRMGQLIRVRRSHLTLDGPEGTGALMVAGKGKKHGGLVVLLPEEMAVLRDVLTTGFLAPLEAEREAGRVKDYPLFPQGPLTGGRRTPGEGVCRVAQATAPHCTMSAVRKWFKEAAVIAGVPEIKGRVTYGVKRAVVDRGKDLKLSRDALASLGLWKGTEMADRVYADQDAFSAAIEAARARQVIREVGDAPCVSSVKTDNGAPE